MLASISTRQFQEWRAYSDLEPFDEVRADLRTASVVQTLHNLERVRQRKRPKVTLSDVLLNFGGDAEPAAPSPEESRAEVLRTMGLLMTIYNEPDKPDKKRRKRGKRKA